MKELVSIFKVSVVAFVVFFQSCSEAPVGEKEEVESSSKKEVVKDTTVKKETVLQSESVSIKPSGTPFLLIQNCAALWPIACDSNLITNESLALEEIEEYFGTKKLMSIGVNGTRPQIIENVKCMKGECKGNQISFDIDNPECYGVLVREDFLEENQAFKIVSTIKLESIRDTNLVSLLGMDSLLTGIRLELKNQFQDSTEYLQVKLKADSAQGYLSQTVFYQEEGELSPAEMEVNPYANGLNVVTSYRRRFVKIGGKLHFSPWEKEVYEWETGRAETMSVSYSKKEIASFYYHGAGICCPARSTVALVKSEIVGDSIKITNVETHQAGLGQPCD